MNNMERLDAQRKSNFEKEVERQNSWEAGWNRAMKSYSETASKASERGAAAFESVVSNMDRSLRQFVETGKFNFKELVGSIIQDLIYMEMKAQAMMIVRMLFSSFSGMFTGGTTPYVPTYGGGTATAATGGDIDGPTLVGENGPEIFVPSQRGTVIPNTQAPSWGSNQPSVVYNGPYIENMSAMDTQTATQFLAKNKMAVWSANQSASRAVPTSR